MHSISAQTFARTLTWALPPSLIGWVATTVALTLSLSGCSASSAESFEGTIDAPRVLPAGSGAGLAVNWQATPAERFGMSSADFKAPAAQGPGATGSSDANSSGLTWTAPDTWQQGAPRQFRAVTFQLSQETECYVTLLPGEGGGLLSNINRWRKQMGQGMLETADLASLPQSPMCGVQAFMVDIPGQYSGMQGETVGEARMLGALGQLPGQAIFVKMIGPDREVEAARGDFEKFCASLQVAQ